MSDFIGIDISGDKEIKEMLDALPDEVANAGADEGYKYLQNVFRAYPPENHSITRKQAYPEVGGWFTVKQRRWFFASLKDGTLQLPYERTQRLSRGWEIIGEGKDAILVNEVPYAKWVMQKATQARMMALIGWKTVEDILVERKERLLQRIGGGVKKALKRLARGE